MKPEIEIIANYKSFKIKINGILHLHFYKDEYVGLQSWIDDNFWIIKIYLKDTTILLEYINEDLWKAILVELEKVL